MNLKASSVLKTEDDIASVHADFSQFRPEACAEPIRFEFGATGTETPNHWP